MSKYLGTFKKKAKTSLPKWMYDYIHMTARGHAGGIAKRKPKKIEKQASGVMVCLYLPPEIQTMLAVEGGEPPGDLHVTLAYVPGIGDDEEKFGAMVSALEVVAKDFSDIEGWVGGVGRFNASPSSDGKDVYYASFNSPVLPALQAEVMWALEVAGIEPSRAHGFTPHITLKYIDPMEGLPVEKKASDRFKVSHLSIVSKTFAAENVPFTGMRVLKSKPSNIPVPDEDKPKDDGAIIPDIANLEAEIMKGYHVAEDEAVPDPATSDDAEPSIPLEEDESESWDELIADEAIGGYWSDATSSATSNRAHGYPSQGAITPEQEEEMSDEQLESTVVKSREEAVDMRAVERDQRNLQKLKQGLQSFVNMFSQFLSEEEMEDAEDLDGDEEEDEEEDQEDDQEEIEKSVGGEVTEVIEVSDGKVWVNTDDNGDECAIFCDPDGETISVGDSLWWQGGIAYWTPEDKSRADVELIKIGASGVSRPDEDFEDEILKGGDWDDPNAKVKKSVEDTFSKPRMVAIAKANPKRQLVHCVVLSPHELDAQDDWMTPEDIEDAAHLYMRRSRVIGADHTRKIDAEPVESYIAPQDMIWESGPYGSQIVKKGSWVLGIKVHDPKEWAKVENGDYQGVSVGGFGVRT